MFGAGPAEYPQTDNLLGSLAFWTFLLLKLATNTGGTNHYYSLKNKKMSLWGYFYCDFLWHLSAFWRRSIVEYLGLYVFIFQWVLCIFSPPKNLFETAVLMLRVHSSHSLTIQEATTASLSSSMLQRPHRPSPPPLQSMGHWTPKSSLSSSTSPGRTVGICFVYTPTCIFHYFRKITSSKLSWLLQGWVKNQQKSDVQKVLLTAFWDLTEVYL